MIYKRKGEETVKQCENWTCQTCWKDSWLERWQDENTCPICGTEFELYGVSGEVHELPPIKDKPKDKMYYKQIKKIELESKIKILEVDLYFLESTTVFAGWQEYEPSSTFMKARHIKELGKIKLKRIQLSSLKMALEDINGQIDKVKDIVMRKERN
jgi:hypothetical protein